MALGYGDVEWNGPAWERLRRESRQKAAWNAAHISRRRMKSDIRRKRRTHTGAMAASVNVRRNRERGEKTVYSVGSPLPYFVYQDQGVGPIYPSGRGKLHLKFRKISFPYPGGAYATRTSGIPAGNFTRDTLRRVKFTDFYWKANPFKSFGG